ncbi:MAG: AAA family ATPase [Myxococcales bacterium]
MWTGLRQIHLGARYAVFRGERYGEPFVVKMARTDRADGESASRLRHEHALLSRLVAPGVVRPHNLELIDGCLALVLEDVGTRDIEETLRGAPLDVAAFLRLAVQMAAAVAGVHRQNIIHRDVSPANFVLDDHGGVTLVDFELATVVTGLAELPRGTGRLEATLPYVAPEQTGRTNRWVDQRADLYSLGATFYQMLTGAPPFPSTDPLEVLHGHLARLPALPATIRPGLPQLLSDIVMKLLAKMPEWRYQTADALEADLAEAQRRWLRDGSLGTFELARLDRRELSLAQSLYGRERERAELATAYESVRAGGNTLAVVQGWAGVGKTALVEDLRGRIAEEALFAAGKCQPLLRHVPFAVLAQALDELTRERLDPAGQTVSELSDRVRKMVGPHAGVLTSIVPRLEALFGVQPPLLPVGPVEAENRTQHALASFLRALAQPGRPLVLFFDDLQWADAASLKLLGALLSGAELGNLLIIVSWRSEEAAGDHPAACVVEEIRGAGGHVVTISLAPLGVDAFVEMLGDVLRAPPERCRPLAELVLHKTTGNPLFATRFLRMLHGADCLTFDAGANTWTWDLARIAALPAPDSVIDLLVQSIRRLPEATALGLTVAACIGSRFELELVARVAAQSEPEMAQALWFAAREHLITLGRDADRERPAYRFVHDRVQQAAYELLPEARRLSLHRAIGEALRERTPLPLFEVVEQLNRAESLLTLTDERLELAELNARAAERAKTGAAYEVAIVYLRRALALLGPAGFSIAHELAIGLHRDAAQLAFVSGAKEEAEELLHHALSSARTRLEKAQLYEVRVFGYTMLLDFPRAIQAGSEALRLFGLELFEADPELTAAQVTAEVEGVLAGLNIEELANVPPAQDPEQVALQTLLLELLPPFFRSDPKRWTVLALWLLRSVVKHGSTALAAPAYANFCVVLVRRGELARAQAFSQLAVGLAGKLGARAAATLFVTGSMSHWWSPLRSVIPELHVIAAKGIESGELMWAWYSELKVVRTLLLAGDELRSTAAVLEPLVGRPGQRGWTSQLKLYQQAIRCLQGATPQRGRFEEETESAIVRPGSHDRYALGEYATTRLQLAFVFGDVDGALGWLEQGAQHEDVLACLDIRPVFATYAALSLVAAAERGSPAERATRLARSHVFEAQLSRWAKHCPENYRHKHELLRAELERVEGGSPEPHFHAAIEAAAQAGALHEQALAQELYARFCLSQGHPHVAAQWFRGALDTWSHYGASAKVKQLEEEVVLLSLPAARRWTTPITSGEGVSFDALTLFKAAETLSSEVVLDKLLEKLMHICVEAAGAQRAALLVERDGQLRLEARLDVERGLLEVSGDHQGNGRILVSEAIVLHTLRSGEDVVLANAAEAGAFTADPYVRARASKSIVSLPVRHRDRITAVLFLENDLSSDAFTKKRLEMLRLLVVQAAISLENARLYDSLRGSEALLRDFLEGMPVGVYVVNPRGEITLANRKAIEITGAPHDPTPTLAQATMAHHIVVAGTNEAYPMERLPASRALQGETVMVDDIAVARRDRTVPIAAWATPIHGQDGAVRYAIVAFQDISAQREMETDRARLEAQLHQAQRLESIGRLSGGIAHDFNNLLTPILIYSELAIGALPEKSPIRAQIAQVRDAAESAASLTRQLLAFGRQQVLEPRELDLNQELLSFERMFRRLVREDIEVRLDLDRAIKLVLADHAQMQRVLMNLGTNAADAMPSSGTITFETRQGTLLASDVDQPNDEPPVRRAAVVLRVHDTGQGMDTITLDKLFDPFFTTKPPGKGTGLGLPTVYGIVKQHGGEMSVHSEPGRGTTFEITLPCVTDGTPLAQRSLSAGRDAVARSGGGETVLVVDDNDAVRNVVREVLEAEGYHVLAFGSSLEALDVARKLGGSLDLLVTDIVMPGMGGRELYERLAPELPHAAVLFISGYTGEYVPNEADTQAGVGRLQKPISREALCEKARALLDARSGSKG